MVASPLRHNRKESTMKVMTVVPKEILALYNKPKCIKEKGAAK